jgi:hypothetical protein
MGTGQPLPAGEAGVMLRLAASPCVTLVGGRRKSWNSANTPRTAWNGDSIDNKVGGT